MHEACKPIDVAAFEQGCVKPATAAAAACGNAFSAPAVAMCQPGVPSVSQSNSGEGAAAYARVQPSFVNAST